MSAWKFVGPLLLLAVLASGCEPRPDARPVAESPLQSTPAPQAGVSDPIMLSGTVEGVPAAGATVELYVGGKLLERVRSDGSGRFALSLGGVDGGLVKLVARLPAGQGAPLTLVSLLGPRPQVAAVARPFRPGMRISVATTANYLLMRRLIRGEPTQQQWAALQERLWAEEAARSPLLMALYLAVVHSRPMPAGIASTLAFEQASVVERFLQHQRQGPDWAHLRAAFERAVDTPAYRIERPAAVAPGGLTGAAYLTPQGLLVFGEQGRGTLWQAASATADLRPQLFGWAFDEKTQRLSLQFAEADWALVIRSGEPRNGFIVSGRTSGGPVRFVMHRVYGVGEHQIGAAYWSTDKLRPGARQYRYLSFSGRLDTGGTVQVMAYRDGQPRPAQSFDFQVVPVEGIRVLRLTALASESGDVSAHRYWFRLDGPGDRLRLAELVLSPTGTFLPGALEELVPISEG